MKSTFITMTLCAGLVVAKPLEKRVLKTVMDIDTVTVTVSGYEAAAATQFATVAITTTIQASAPGGGWWGGWGAHSWSQGAAATTTAAATSATTVTESPISTPETSTSTEAAPTTMVWSESSSVAATSTSASAASSSTATSDYASAILSAHNLHRANNSAPGLSWSDDMASIAQTIAASCVYAHNTAAGGGGYGQNIGAGAQGSDVPAMIGNEMYNGEINSYPGYGSEPDMSNFESWGHYSQIVWKSTTSVGCYTQYCPSGLANVGSDVSPYFTVCNYSPPGNFGGEYAANVLQPKGEAPLTL